VLMQKLGVDMEQLVATQGRSLATTLDDWRRKRTGSGS
jgi:hypothetical protein